MTVLIILNDPPYGSERAYNGLRLALQLGRQGASVRVFLMADAVTCAKAGQATPDGYYNLERMLGGVLKRGGELAACGTCMDARGLRDDDLMQGVQRGSMDQLGRWVVEAERVVSF